MDNWQQQFIEYIKVLFLNSSNNNLKDVFFNIEDSESRAETFKILKEQKININKIKKMVHINDENNLIIDDIKFKDSFFVSKEILDEQNFFEIISKYTARKVQFVFVEKENDDEQVDIYKILFDQQLPQVGLNKTISLQEFNDIFKKETLFSQWSLKKINEMVFRDRKAHVLSPSHKVMFAHDTFKKRNGENVSDDEELLTQTTVTNVSFCLYRSNNNIIRQDVISDVIKEPVVWKENDTLWKNFTNDNIFYFQKCDDSDNLKVYKIEFQKSSDHENAHVGYKSYYLGTILEKDIVSKNLPVDFFSSASVTEEMNLEDELENAKFKLKNTNTRIAQFENRLQEIVELSENDETVIKSLLDVEIPSKLLDDLIINEESCKNSLKESQNSQKELTLKISELRDEITKIQHHQEDSEIKIALLEQERKHLETALDNTNVEKEAAVQAQLDVKKSSPNIFVTGLNNLLNLLNVFNKKESPIILEEIREFEKKIEKLKDKIEKLKDEQNEEQTKIENCRKEESKKKTALRQAETIYREKGKELEQKEKELQNIRQEKEKITQQLQEQKVPEELKNALQEAMDERVVEERNIKELEQKKLKLKNVFNKFTSKKGLYAEFVNETRQNEASALHLLQLVNCNAETANPNDEVLLTDNNDETIEKLFKQKYKDTNTVYKLAIIYNNESSYLTLTDLNSKKEIFNNKIRFGLLDKTKDENHLPSVYFVQNKNKVEAWSLVTVNGQLVLKRLKSYTLEDFQTSFCNDELFTDESIIKTLNLKPTNSSILNSVVQTHNLKPLIAPTVPASFNLLDKAITMTWKKPCHWELMSKSSNFIFAKDYNAQNLEQADIILVKKILFLFQYKKDIVFIFNKKGKFLRVYSQSKLGEPKIPLNNNGLFQNPDNIKRIEKIFQSFKETMKTKAKVKPKIFKKVKKRFFGSQIKKVYKIYYEKANAGRKARWCVDGQVENTDKIARGILDLEPSQVEMLRNIVGEEATNFDIIINEKNYLETISYDSFNGVKNIAFKKDDNNRAVLQTLLDNLQDAKYDLENVNDDGEIFVNDKFNQEMNNLIKKVNDSEISFTDITNLKVVASEERSGNSHGSSFN